MSDNAAPTNRTVTTDEDTAYPFTSADAFTDTDSGDGLVSVKVVTLPECGQSGAGWGGGDGGR